MRSLELANHLPSTILISYSCHFGSFLLTFFSNPLIHFLDLLKAQFDHTVCPLWCWQSVYQAQFLFMLFWFILIDTFSNLLIHFLDLFRVQLDHTICPLWCWQTVYQAQFLFMSFWFIFIDTFSNPLIHFLDLFKAQLNHTVCPPQCWQTVYQAQFLFLIHVTLVYFYWHFFLIHSSISWIYSMRNWITQYALLGIGISFTRHNSYSCHFGSFFIDTFSNPLIHFLDLFRGQLNHKVCPPQRWQTDYRAQFLFMSFWFIFIATFPDPLTQFWVYAKLKWIIKQTLSLALVNP